MESAEIMMIFKEGMMVVAKLAGPILLASVLIGLVIAIFQAATQIHEQTLTFVPKLIVIGLILLFGGSWMMTTMVEFFQFLLDKISLI
ncbi:MAG: flagellar biosynthesis protein FliQ [Erysipelotrichaceae bacterium]